MKFNALTLLSVVGVMALGAPIAQAQDNIAARDIATSSIDVKLINQCIETGQSKKDCLCVTKINKYELSLAEYKLAAKLFGRSNERTAGAFNTPAVVKAAQKQNTLISQRDFKARCEMASDYFAQNQS